MAFDLFRFHFLSFASFFIPNHTRTPMGWQHTTPSIGDMRNTYNIHELRGREQLYRMLLETLKIKLLSLLVPLTQDQYRCLHNGKYLFILPNR